MRIALALLIDIAFSQAAIQVVGHAYGFGWGTVAGLAVLFYGGICFIDGRDD